MSDLLPTPSPQLLDDKSVTQRYVAQNCMMGKNFNPFERLMALADKLEAVADVTDKDGNLTDQRYVKERINIYTSLAKFYAPQPKAIDINIATDNKYVIQAVDFTGLIQERPTIPAGTYDGPSLTLLTSGKDATLVDEVPLPPSQSGRHTETG
jgi:hypothetical protein